MSAFDINLSFTSLKKNHFLMSSYIIKRYVIKMNDEKFYMQILFLGTFMPFNLRHMQLIECGFQSP